MDSTNRFQHNVIVKMIETHLRSLRKTPMYRGAHIFVFVEANYGGWWGTDVVRNVVEQAEFAPITCVSYDETPKDRVGIWMSDEVKRCMAGEMERALGDGQLCFAKEFVTAAPRKPADIQKEFREQLSNYREELIKPKDEATGITKKVVTGKTSGGRKDDLCIAAQIALYFSGKKRREESFRNLARDRGWRF